MKSKDALTLCLENIREGIKRAQVDAGMYSSGVAAASLRNEVTEVTATMFGNTSIAVQLGLIEPRGPGGLPPIENIILWIKLKMLQLSPWAVAKTIAAKGTKMFRGEVQPLSIEEVIRIERARLITNLLQGTKEEVLLKIRAAIQK